MTGGISVQVQSLSATASGSGRRRTALGFTLLELMIVVAVVAILAGIAYPSYQDSVRKGRRGQAKADLLELTQRAERFHTVNNTYSGFNLTVAEQKSPQDGAVAYYTVSIAGQTGSTYTLTAAPTTAGHQDADKCGTLRITAAGVKTATGGTTQECF